MKKVIKAVTIEDWRTEIRKYFPDYVFPAEVALSVVCQLRIRDVFNPFGVIFVGDSSSGKTTILDFFLSSMDKVYRSDNFTAASFVSQASNVAKGKMHELDLLPKIENKTLIVKELSPMFGKRDENIEADFSVLTTVFDGMGYVRDAGTHGKRGYERQILFMFLGATIPFKQKVLEIIGKLGARILFLKIKTHYKNGRGIAQELLADRSYADKLLECQKVTESFLAEMWKTAPAKIQWDRTEDNPDLVEDIGNVALLGSILRAPVDVRQERCDDQNLYYFSPRKEGPMRLAMSLYNFCRAHALVCGRMTLGREDIPMALRLVVDSAPMERVHIINMLINKPEGITTSDVEEALECSKPTALFRMKEFASLGIARFDDLAIGKVGRSEKTLILKSEFFWLKGKQFREYRKNTHPQNF